MAGSEQYLRDEYKGKTLWLREFYSQDRLLYDSKVALIGKKTSGDWKGDGFVVVDDVHTSGPRLVIEARRQLVISIGRLFQFRSAEQPTADKKGKRPVSLEITIDFGKDISTAEQATTVLSKIFLTPQDDLAKLVPDYWNRCVTGGLMGKNA